MRQRLVGMALAAIATMSGATAPAQGVSGAVRPEDAAIRALIASGLKRSATFRDLNTRLDDTDVVVYVRFSRCLAGVPACLVWVSHDTDVRRLLIKIDRFGRAPDELTALLAHELQHAHEVAAAPEIRDVASFQRSFASRGWKNTDGFETEAARKVATIVAAELSRARGLETQPVQCNQRIDAASHDGAIVAPRIPGSGRGPPARPGSTRSSDCYVLPPE